MNSQNKKMNVKGIVIFCSAMFIIVGLFLVIAVIVSDSSERIEAAPVWTTHSEPEEEKEESVDPLHAAYGDLPDVRIELTVGDNKDILDFQKLREIVTVKQENSEYTYNADENALKEYTAGLKKKYDNHEAYISFKASDGTEMSLENKSHGWIFDADYASEMLRKYISNCQSVKLNLTDRSKESNKWWIRVYYDYDYDKKKGSSYAEVSIEQQYMWVYKDGKVVLESGVVTGNPGTESDTPKGAFHIYEKKSPCTLYSPGNYNTEVSYWMAFVDDVGFHDAEWQESFGGNTYLSNGSHGCVNLPLDVAEKLYEISYVNMPVYVY